MAAPKSLLFIYPISEPLKSLMAVIDEIKEEENIEVFEIDDIGEVGQLVANLGQCLLLFSNAKKCARTLQGSKKYITKTKSKVLLLAQKEIPRNTLNKFVKIGLTECMVEPVMPKTLLYKVKLYLKSFIIESEEEDEDGNKVSSNVENSEDDNLYASKLKDDNNLFDEETEAKKRKRFFEAELAKNAQGKGSKADNINSNMQGKLAQTNDSDDKDASLKSQLQQQMLDELDQSVSKKAKDFDLFGDFESDDEFAEMAEEEKGFDKQKLMDLILEDAIDDTNNDNQLDDATDADLPKSKKKADLKMEDADPLFDNLLNEDESENDNNQSKKKAALLLEEADAEKLKKEDESKESEFNNKLKNDDETDQAATKDYHASDETAAGDINDKTSNEELAEPLKDHSLSIDDGNGQDLSGKMKAEDDLDTSAMKGKLSKQEDLPEMDDFLNKKEESDFAINDKLPDEVPAEELDDDAILAEDLPQGLINDLTEDDLQAEDTTPDYQEETEPLKKKKDYTFAEEDPLQGKQDDNLQLEDQENLNQTDNELSEEIEKNKNKDLEYATQDPLKNKTKQVQAEEDDAKNKRKDEMQDKEQDSRDINLEANLDQQNWDNLIDHYETVDYKKKEKQDDQSINYKNILNEFNDISIDRSSDVNKSARSQLKLVEVAEHNHQGKPEDLIDSNENNNEVFDINVNGIDTVINIMSLYINHATEDKILNTIIKNLKKIQNPTISFYMYNSESKSFQEKYYSKRLDDSHLSNELWKEKEKNEIKQWLNTRIPTWSDEKFINDENQFIFPYFEASTQLGFTVLHWNENIAIELAQRIEIILESARGLFLQNYHFAKNGAEYYIKEAPVKKEKSTFFKSFLQKLMG